MALRRWLARINLRLREAMHCRVGAFFLRRGDLARARRHFLRAAEQGYPSFRAHLQLGKIYLHQDRMARAVEELHRAREIDPHRFAREGFPGDPLLWIAERLPESRVRNLAVSPSSATPAPSAEPPRDVPAAAEAEDLPYGDFLDESEAERFSALPPISVHDLEDVDWDEVARELNESD